MKILVTGATSGLGRNAVQYLLQSGESVVATGRNCEVGRSLTNAGAQFVALDLTEATEDDCARLMDGCDAVWHCAAKSSPRGDKTAFWLANVKVTHTLAQAAGRLNIPGLSISPRLRFTLIFNITMTCQKLILREHSPAIMPAVNMPLSRLLLALFLDILPRDLFFCVPVVCLAPMTR